MENKAMNCADMNAMLGKQAVDAECQPQKKPYEEPSVVFVPADVLWDTVKELTSCPFMDI